jgi:hypothetical protein
MHTLNYDIADKTTSDLLELSVNLFARKLQGEFTVIGVESGNPDLDYYLSCPNKSLATIRKPITLTPLVQEKCQGINRFKFLKVVGIGGFSRVYLGNELIDVARSKADGQFYALKLLEKKKVI